MSVIGTSVKAEMETSETAAAAVADTSDDLDNWNSGERGGVAAEKGFPLMLQSLNSGVMSRRLRHTLQQYIRGQDLSWMTDDLAFLGTHTISFADCGVVRRVNSHLLGGRSEFFRGVFVYTAEKTIDIRLDWLSPIAPSMVSAVDAADLSGCDVPLTDDTCLQVFLAADFLLCDPLRTKCLDYIRSRCEDSGALALAAWACVRPFSLGELARVCKRSVLLHFGLVRQTEEFLDLESSALQELLSHRMLNCSSELQVLETVGQWLHHRPPQQQLKPRALELEQLLCCVRLSQMQPEQLRAAQNLPATAACQEFAEYVLAYPKPTQFSARHHLQLSHLSGPRRPHWVTLLLCASVSEPTLENQLAPLIYNQRTHAWDLSPPDGRAVPWFGLGAPASQVTEFACLATGDDRVYLIGGRRVGGDRLAAVPCPMVWRFDRGRPDAGWQECSRLTLARCRHCCAAVGGFVYAAGGLVDSNQPTAAVERMTLSGEANCWSAIDPMRRARSDAAAVAHNGKLLVVGGFDGRWHLNGAEVYCPTNGVWTSLSGSMCQRRSGLGLVACGGGAVYALCGRNSRGWRRSIERWEEGRGWKADCKITVHRSHFGYSAIGNIIFLFGGVNASGAVVSTEWVDLNQQPALCGQGCPISIPGTVSFGACLLSVAMDS